MKCFCGSNNAYCQREFIGKQGVRIICPNCHAKSQLYHDERNAIILTAGSMRIYKRNTVNA